MAFDDFIATALPYIFLTAAIYTIGLAICIRRTKSKLIQRGHLMTKKIMFGLKKFFAFVAWRLSLPTKEPVKCQCSFCARWADILKMKAYRRMQEEREAEWLCCSRCESENYPVNCGWRLIEG